MSSRTRLSAVLAGAVLALVAAGPAAAANPVPVAAPASPVPPPSVVPGPPSSAELQEQARRQADDLAQQQARQGDATAQAGAALERYQLAVRAAEEAARAAADAAAALAAAQAATDTARTRLVQYAGALYRTGPTDPTLSLVGALTHSNDPGQLLTGLSLAGQVAGRQSDALTDLAAAQAEQDRAAASAAAGAVAAQNAADAAAQLKAAADAAVALAAQRVAAAAQALAATAGAVQVAAGRDARLARAEALAGPISVPPGACTGTSTAGYPNGLIPTAALCPLWGARGQLLRADAAATFEVLSKAYAQEFGAPMCVTDSYRDYAGQVAVAAAKPTLAAVPGTSNHGWGVAVDLCGGVEAFGTAQHAWLAANAVAYGWFHPAWAEPTGSRPEPWHWEYVGQR